MHSYHLALGYFPRTNDTDYAAEHMLSHSCRKLSSILAQIESAAFTPGSPQGLINLNGTSKRM
jgi:hypothetical protein